MDTRLKQNKRLLEKVFEFLKVDLITLDPNERRTLADDMIPFFLPPFDPDAAKSKLGIDFIRAYEKMVKPFEKRNELVEFLIKQNLISHVQNEAKNALTDLITKGWGKIVSPLMQYPMVKDGIITRVTLPSIGHDHDPTHMFTNLFLTNLNEIILGIPQNSIKICPNCGAYFLNLTRRKKEYCSPNCTWKVLARKRREELKKHPRKYKAYLKKQKEIMRRKYEEKRKAELGPNVKVKRRKEG